MNCNASQDDFVRICRYPGKPVFAWYSDQLGYVMSHETSEYVWGVGAQKLTGFSPKSALFALGTRQACTCHIHAQGEQEHQHLLLFAVCRLS